MMCDTVVCDHRSHKTRAGFPLEARSAGGLRSPRRPISADPLSRTEIGETPGARVTSAADAETIPRQRKPVLTDLEKQRIPASRIRIRDLGCCQLSRGRAAGAAGVCWPV